MDKSEGFRLYTICLICAVVLLFLLIGLFVFVIIRDRTWHDRQIAQKKCKEYVQYACKNPFVDKMSHESDLERILQGENAPLGMFPHQAYVEFQIRRYPYRLIRCGGSLISEYYVLSAAHCIDGLRKPYGKVKLGSIFRTNDGTGEWFKILRVHRHPDYKQRTLVNDLLLLELDKKVNFKAHLRPICLHTEFLSEYNRAIATGWGRTEDGFEPKCLKMVQLYFNQSDVNMKCRALRKKSNHRSKICAGHPTTSRSAHEGDSGGPLQVPLNNGCPNTYELIGVTTEIENRPEIQNQTFLSFYTKVELFVPWIVSEVWPDEP